MQRGKREMELMLKKIYLYCEIRVNRAKLQRTLKIFRKWTRLNNIRIISALFESLIL